MKKDQLKVLCDFIEKEAPQMAGYVVLALDHDGQAKVQYWANPMQMSFLHQVMQQAISKIICYNPNPETPSLPPVAKQDEIPPGIDPFDKPNDQPAC